MPGIDDVDRMFGAKPSEMPDWSPEAIAAAERIKAFVKRGEERLTAEREAQEVRHSRGVDHHPDCSGVAGDCSCGFADGPAGRATIQRTYASAADRREVRRQALAYAIDSYRTPRDHRQNPTDEMILATAARFERYLLGEGEAPKQASAEEQLAGFGFGLAPPKPPAKME